MSSQPDSHYYDILLYDTKRRFISYWYQITETLALNPENVLEVGVGAGFVQRYLSQLNIPVTSLDSDSNLRPNVVGSIIQTPFADKQFSVVMACEVLEHMPYEDAVHALKEIARITKYAVISIPNNTPWYKIDINVPVFGRKKWFYTRNKIIKHDFTKDSRGHFWEIGTNTYPLSRVEADVQKYFSILKSYRVTEHPAHHFFILESLS